MKKLVKFFAVAALLGTLMTTQSCTKTCDAGYEGSDCKTLMTAKFINSNWSVTESKNGGTPYTYSSSISQSSTDISKVLISKVANQFFNSNVVGTVSNSTTITITNQNPDGDNYYITTTGTNAVANNVMTLNYSITGPNGATPPVTVTDNYTSTWTHQ